MKKITSIFTLTALLMFSSFIYGQKTAIDSACVQIENKAGMNLAIYSYKNLAENVEKDFKSFQLILKETKDIPEKIPYSINYEPNKSVTIKQTEEGERVIWENGEQTIYQFNKQCNILSDTYFLQIQFNELDELISDSLLTQLLEVIDTTTAIQGRHSAIYNYTFDGMQLSQKKQYDMLSEQTDMLMLSGGVGVNLIKSEPVIDISAEMAFAFRKKRTLQNRYYVSYNLLFDFIEESTVNVNGFLNIGYKYNLSKKINKPNWLGVELGVLVNRQGELFGKNTFKLGVNWELGKYISVAPQLYMSDNFDQFYPAVRIGFGF
ncbi:hypothetical protein [uncultured Eudoraea sp.]|uniref:hypothetical protein n=1 Tax=uncultured Eudoraea sp. TaxID=1035614 RepID=UPI002612C8F0|nr:hypothetical protein [uncultured Eudoraea sp.]